MTLPNEPPMATDLAEVWRRVPTRHPVAFITVDDGYAVCEDAAAYIRANNLPVGMFFTWYAMSAKVDHFKTYGFHAYLGNHSTSHIHMPTVDAAEQRRQIDMCTGNLVNHFAVTPRLFRPPYGEYNEDTRRQAKAAGYDRITLWESAYHGGLRTEGPAPTAGSILLAHFEADLLQNLITMVNEIRVAGLRPASLLNYLPPVSGGQNRP